MNDRADIAFVLGLEGVRLGQDDLSVADARLLLGSHAIIGISVENMRQIKTVDGAAHLLQALYSHPRLKRHRLSGD